MRAFAVLLLLCTFGMSACGDDKPAAPDGARVTMIAGAGGAELDAVEMGDGPVGVVLAHGASTRKEMWYRLMPALADAGMHAVAFDFGSDRTGDVRAVMGYLTDAGAAQIVLVGSSLGASNILDVASEEPVAGVVTFSVPGMGSWAIDEPGLYIASEDDGGTAKVARSLAEQFDGDVLVVEGGTHGADLLKPHPEVVDDVVTFIQRATATG